jgi:hypothetical protein
LATVVVIGLALEVAGAALLAAELLTLDPEVLARRGNVYTQSGEPHLWAQLPSARTFAGFGLLPDLSCRSAATSSTSVRRGSRCSRRRSPSPAWSPADSSADRVLTVVLYRRALGYRERHKVES